MSFSPRLSIVEVVGKLGSILTKGYGYLKSVQGSSGNSMVEGFGKMDILLERSVEVVGDTVSITMRGSAVWMIGPE